MAPELHGSHHTYGSMLPDGTPTFPPVDRYKDPDHLKRSLRKRKSVEDALETLRKYDTVLVVDDSGSMQGRRWEEVGALIRRHVLRTGELTLSYVCYFRQKMHFLAWPALLQDTTRMVSISTS